MYYLGVDPGKDKVGLAVVNQELDFIEGLVIKSKDFKSEVEKLQKEYKCEKILLGNGTSSKNFLMAIKKMSYKYELVNERDSTLLARQEYWNHNPPRGLKRLIPLSLQSPRKDIDDYAAYIIAIRYLRD